MIKKISFFLIILIVVSILKYLDSDSFPFGIVNKDKNWVYLIDWIYLTIFIVILCFFFTYSKWKEKTRKDNRDAIIAYCCLNAIIAFSCASGIANQKSRERDRYEKCWNNIRVIQEAIERYNMDSSVMMTTEIDFEKLIEGNYLKSIPEGSEKICCYKVFQDLADVGFVYCVKHKYPGLNILKDYRKSLKNLNLEYELKANPQWFSDEEKEFILESNKELEIRKKELGIEIENANELTNDKFIVLVVSLPLIFLFFPSVALRN